MNRISKLIAVFVFASLAFNQVAAQELSYGFKIGLNSSTMLGDSEMSDAGTAVETNAYVTGFHLGGTILLGFTDNYGIKADLMFSQKGGRIKYDGQSFLIFNALSGEQVMATGTQTTFLRVTNSYFDIPIMGYARFNKLELSAGVNVGFLVGSTGVGETTFVGNSADKNDLVSIVYNLDHNYFKDEPTQGPSEGQEIIEILADGETINFPKTVGGYYNYDSKDGNRYNPLDLGLNAGISFYVNMGLFIGVRANYGLNDLSNNFFDRSQVKSEGFNYISRSDKDSNLSLQASVGFTF